MSEPAVRGDDGRYGEPVSSARPPRATDVRGQNLWSAYVRTVADGEEQAAIAERAAVSQGTVSRWLSGRYIPDKAAPVVGFARAYGREVLEALVAAQMLTLDEASRGLSDSGCALLERLAADVTPF